MSNGKMATTEADLIWSENVCTLAEAVSSHTVPIIVRVVEGTYVDEESESLSKGDIFKVDLVNGDVITGNYCKEMPNYRQNIIQDDSIPCKQISIDMHTAKVIDVAIFQKKSGQAMTSTSNGNNLQKHHDYVDFSLPVPAARTSLSDKKPPPAVSPRVKTKPHLKDEERKPLSQPCKLCTLTDTEHRAMGIQVHTSPVRSPKNDAAMEVWKEDHEEVEDDVYEIPDEQEGNIYDEPENLEIPQASKPAHSLKHKTMEFFATKIKVKDRVLRIKSKVTSALRRDKAPTDANKMDEDDEDGDYDVCRLTRKTNDRQQCNDNTRYDTLEKRLTLRKIRDNAYSSLSLSGADTSFGSLSVAGLASRLATCGLNDMAEMCLKEMVDGRLFLSLTDDDLRDVFSVTELQIKKIHMAQKHNWTPKT